MTEQEFKTQWALLTKEEKRNLMEMALNLAHGEIIYAKLQEEKEKKENTE